MAGLLLDTHTAIWWWTDTPRLGAAACQALLAGDRPVHVSVVSALEIAIKFRIGKLATFPDPALDYPALMAANGFLTLEVAEQHALRAGLLPGDHRDPFHRIIAAQALTEGLTLITRDPVFEQFGCRILW